MPVRFTGPNGPEELIPAPFVSIDKTYLKNENGDILHPEYTFTLNGTIVNVGTDVDSPDAQTYGFASMEDILAEQKRIRTLFSNEGGRLEIETPGGGGPNTIDAYCKIENIEFKESTWTIRCDYTIVLKSNKIEGDTENTTDIDSAQENWNITENEDGTYSISHDVRAVGSIRYGASGRVDALGAAKSYCNNKRYTISNGSLMPLAGSGVLSLDNTFALSGIVAANYWNYALVESIGALSNSWQISESFIYNPSGTYREEYIANVNFNNDNLNRQVVAINGNVFGFADRNSDLTTRNSRAKSAFLISVEPNIYTRATTHASSGFTVNPIPISKQLTYEQNAGILRYAYTYTAVSGSLFPDSIDESISVSDTGYTDIFAQIPVPGRANGPVVQYMNTSTLPERTVTINLILASSGTVTQASLLDQYLSRPDTDAIINALKPNAGFYYVRQNSIDWNPIRRQYARVVSWVLEPEGVQVEGIPTSGFNNTRNLR